MSGETNPVIEKNGKGYILRMSNFSLFVTSMVALSVIISFIFMPYKAFTDFANESRNDRTDIRRTAVLADSVASLSLKYSIENNYNMKTFFELGQPKHYKWLPYWEIKKKIYLENFDN